ncbi:MAG TPA: hypothetical protein VEQ62_07660 [Stellaceae bacterium]|jgi:hypothetical protein|nr:hypothetical protein [Stellaceae bacterium]
MSDRRPPSRPQETTRLRRVTLRVPEAYAEDLRRYARELRSREYRPNGPASEWRRVSPSAELLIDPECQARGIIRDTFARGADRFHWSVLAPEQLHPVAAGHTGTIVRGRLLAETALRAFVEDWREQAGG